MENSNNKVESTKEHKKLEAAGMLHKYADPSKIPFEKDAWKTAAVEKHKNDVLKK